MTSVSSGHIILTPTQPVGSGRPQRGSNPAPPEGSTNGAPAPPDILSMTYTLTFTATRYLPPYTPHVGPLDPVTFKEATLFTCIRVH